MKKVKGLLFEKGIPLLLFLLAALLSCGRIAPKAITYESEASPVLGDEKAPVTEDMTGALHFDGIWVKTKKGFRLVKIHEYREKAQD